MADPAPAAGRCAAGSRWRPRSARCWSPSSSAGRGRRAAHPPRGRRPRPAARRGRRRRGSGLSAGTDPAELLGRGRRGLLPATGRPGRHGAVRHRHAAAGRPAGAPELPPPTATVSAAARLPGAHRALPDGGTVTVGLPAAATDRTVARVRQVTRAGHRPRGARRGRSGLAAGRSGHAAAARAAGPHRPRSAAARARRTVPPSAARCGRTAETADLADALSGLLQRVELARGESERALLSARDFAAAAEHELRTPLTAMRTDLEVLTAHPDLPAAERAEILAQLAARQQRVEDTLAALAQLAAGDLPSPIRTPSSSPTWSRRPSRRPPGRARRASPSRPCCRTARSPSSAPPPGCGWPWTTCSPTPSGTPARAGSGGGRADGRPRAGHRGRRRRRRPARRAGRPSSTASAAAGPRTAPAPDSGWPWSPSRPRCTAARQRSPTAPSAAPARCWTSRGASAPGSSGPGRPARRAAAAPPGPRLGVDAGLRALGVGDRRRRAGQRVEAGAGLREGDDLADRLDPGQQRRQPVPAERRARVRRRP